MRTSRLQVFFVCVFVQALSGIQGATTPNATDPTTTIVPTTSASASASSSASASASAGASAGGSSSDPTSPAATTTTGTTTTTTLAPLKCYNFSNCDSASSCGTNSVICTSGSCQITRMTTGSNVTYTAACDCPGTTTTATTMTTTTATTTTTTSASSTTTTAATTTEPKCCSDKDNCNAVSLFNTAPEFLPGYLSLILAAGYSLLRMM